MIRVFESIQLSVPKVKFNKITVDRTLYFCLCASSNSCHSLGLFRVTSINVWRILMHAITNRALQSEFEYGIQKGLKISSCFKPLQRDKIYDAIYWLS